MDKEFKKWKEFEDSKEWISYELKIYGDEFVEYDKYRDLIVETLQKIPKDERDNVLIDAIFMVVIDYGQVRSLHIPNPKGNKMIEQPVILLNFALMEKESCSEYYMMDVVAHEIAHFSLGHHETKSKNKTEWMNREKEADDLIEKWGFKRTNYDVYKRRE